MPRTEQVLLSPRQVAESTGLGLSTVFEALRRGDLSSILVGRLRRISPQDRDRWVAWLGEQSEAGRPVYYQSREALAARRSAGG